MCLFWREKKVVDQVIYTNANTNRENKAQMIKFRIEIAEAIWQDFVYYCNNVVT